MNFFKWLAIKLGLVSDDSVQPFEMPKDFVSNGKGALITGINNYPNPENHLSGCLDDVQDWSDILKNTFGFSTQCLLTDGNCTPANVKAALSQMISQSKPGDVLVWTYSGHGTQVPDYNGDELDGYDEAMYLYGTGGFSSCTLLDDDIRAITAKLPQGVQLAVVADCCHSGSITRLILEGGEIQDRKPRFVPYHDDAVSLKMQDVPLKRSIVAKPTEEDMGEVLLSACKDQEVSYDTSFDGRASGAFTYFAIQTIKSNPGATYAEFETSLGKYLPSQDYPMSPQLEGKAVNKARRLFS
jgi:metacaspase-1